LVGSVFLRVNGLAAAGLVGASSGRGCCAGCCGAGGLSSGQAGDGHDEGGGVLHAGWFVADAEVRGFIMLCETEA
jgi:hypothetical protein